MPLHPEIHASFNLNLLPEMQYCSCPFEGNEKLKTSPIYLCYHSDARVNLTLTPSYAKQCLIRKLQWQCYISWRKPGSNDNKPYTHQTMYSVRTWQAFLMILMVGGKRRAATDLRCSQYTGVWLACARGRLRRLKNIWTSEQINRSLTYLLM